MSEVRSKKELNEAAVIVARGLRRSALASIWIACVAICLDVPVFATALWFAQYATMPTEIFGPLRAALAATLTAVAASIVLAVTRSYDLRALRRPLPAIVRALAALMPAVALLSLLIPPVLEPGFLLAALVALLAVVVPTRISGAIGARWLLDSHLLDRRAVIAGGGEHAIHLIRGLAAREDSDIQLHGIFDDRDDIRSPIQILGVPKIGGYDDLITFVRAAEIDMVIIALPLEAEARIKWLLDAFKVLPVEVRLSAFSQDYAFAQADRDPLISAMSRSFAPERRLTKRAFDILFASLALVLLLPLMLVAAIAIRLESRGQILFRQRRHGYNDRIIEVLKFRSMYHEMADPEAKNVVSRNDPRVTRVGRFLRRSSIDELPQLFNVLRGDMSLVGPRPALPSEAQAFGSRHRGRVKVKPGITGLWQVTARDDPSFEEYERLDVFYVENWSVTLDFVILASTAWTVLVRALSTLRSPELPDVPVPLVRSR